MHPGPGGYQVAETLVEAAAVSRYDRIREASARTQDLLKLLALMNGVLLVGGVLALDESLSARFAKHLRPAMLEAHWVPIARPIVSGIPIPAKLAIVAIPTRRPSIQRRAEPKWRNTHSDATGAGEAWPEVTHRHEAEA